MLWSTLLSSIAAKAVDSAVVHNTGNETIGGIKTFTSSPIVPTPTTDSQVAYKELLVRKELRVLKELKDYKELKVLKELPELRELKVKTYKELQVHKGLLEFRV